MRKISDILVHCGSDDYTVIWLFEYLITLNYGLWETEIIKAI